MAQSIFSTITEKDSNPDFLNINLVPLFDNNFDIQVYHLDFFQEEELIDPMEYLNTDFTKSDSDKKSQARNPRVVARGDVKIAKASKYTVMSASKKRK